MQLVLKFVATQVKCKSFLQQTYLILTLCPRRAFSVFKMGIHVCRNSWTRLLKYSKSYRVFCHVTHDEMSSEDILVIGSHVVLHFNSRVESDVMV